MPLRLQPADQLEQRAGRRRAPRLLVGSSSTSTRQPMASARAISTSCCAAGGRSPTARIGRDVAMAELARAPRRAVSRIRRDRRCRTTPPPRPARRRARCSPSRSGAARATAPGRSSRRRRGARRADRAARTARRRAHRRRRRAPSAPARIAISVLLPAPFWPTSAQTSPARDGEIDAVERDGRAERLADAAHLEARRRSAGYFSHLDRSGCSSSLASGSFMCSRVISRTPVSIRCSTGSPLQVRHHRLDAEVAHVDRVLQDEAVDVAVARAP